MRAYEVTLAEGASWSAFVRAAGAGGYVVFAGYDVTDPSSNFERIGRAELHSEAENRRERQGTWAKLAVDDPRLGAGRLLTQAVVALEQNRRRAWDPRLDELLELNASWRQTWQILHPAPPAPIVRQAGGQPVAILAARVTRERNRRPAVAELGLVREWRESLGSQVEVLTVAQCLAAQRVVEICNEVAAHASRLAARTRDRGRGARFAALASDCRELASAASAVARYSLQ